MKSKLKIFLVLSGAALLAVPALQAQRAGGGSRGGAGASRPSFAGARPAAYASGGGRFTNTRPTRGGGYYGRGGGYYRGGGGHHHYGRNYYLGGIPYFYPFYGYGFGYPYYYDSFYGSYGSAFASGAYEGRIAGDRDRDEDNGRDRSGGPSADTKGPSLPSAVQRQLAKRGYYRGKVDGEFGPASREALSRFQKSQDIKASGKIDEETLEALGFTDQR